MKALTFTGKALAISAIGAAAWMIAFLAVDAGRAKLASLKNRGG